jgi:triacylglycerol lipase
MAEILLCARPQLVRRRGSDTMRRTMIRALAIVLFVASCGDEPARSSSPADADPADSYAAKDAGEADAQPAPDAGEADALPDFDAAAPDAGIDPSSPPRPVLFVHGLNGSSAEYQVMIDRLVADGWPPEYLRAIDFDDPRWGCNADNAQQIAEAVASLMADTGEPRVDLVAHSMGALSSRHYLKNLGGTEHVNVYVTLGGMHHGVASACLNPLPVCVWQEICTTGDFVTQLDQDPATPGELFYVSIYSTGDSTISNESSMLDGAENIEVMGVEHAGPDGLLEHEMVHPHVLRVLGYPAW